MPGMLGDFTPEQSPDPAEDASFGWFGATVRISSEFGDLVFQDWAEEFGDKDGEAEGAGYANKILWRRLIHSEDFDEFWSLARTHRQSSEDLARLYVKLDRALTEAATGRPTPLPGDSSPGRTDGTASSAGISYGPGTALSEAAARAASRLEEQGRPDLALVVEKAQESLSA